MSTSPSMLDAILATVVQLAGASAGTLHLPSSNGEPEFFASWQPEQARPGQIGLSSASVVLPLQSGGETLGLFTLHYDASGRAAGTPGTGSAAEAGEDVNFPPDSLTAREQQILSQLAGGSSNKAIARELGISPDTVKLHVRHILAKLGCRSRVAAAVLAARHGLAR